VPVLRVYVHYLVVEMVDEFSVFIVAVPWLRTACSRRLGVEPRSVHVKFVVDRMLLGRVITCFGFNLRHAAGGERQDVGKAVNMHTYII